MNRTYTIRLLSSAAFVVALTAAFTASAQVVPNTARPTTVERDNRIDSVRPEVGGAPVISAPTRERKKSGSGASFALKGIKIEGASVYGEKELGPIYADKIGTKLTLDDLNAVADDVTAYYRNKGYILTRAVLPPQRATGGVVTLRIVEGYVNDVRFAGDYDKGNKDKLQAYANKIKNAKPLNTEDLERYLLLMEDLPGVDARAVLTPAAKATGASDVVVTITRKPINFNVGIDNRGNKFLGPVQANAGVFFNDVLGLDDVTQLRVSNSIFNRSELVFGEIRHTEQVGNEGTTVSLSANKVNTQPGSTLKPLDIKGTSSAITINATHPLIRSRRTNWFVTSDLTFRNVEVDTLGTSLYKDKTRVLNIGTAYDFVDAGSGINKIEANVAKGFNWDTSAGLNARSRANGQTSFVKETAKLTRIQPLWGAFSLYGAASGQYSNDPLLASEEFTVGGAEFGSAYDSAEISGDSGVAARAELQYNQVIDGGYLSQYQLYGFYDIGKVWNENPIPGSENKSDSLASAGLGARFNVLESISGTVEGAVPMTRQVASRNNAGDDARLFMSLQYRY
ncbi:MAG: ShlB/FhaC/HecB family hemolysin secretion/activation protein [Rickettsiales bacterium]